MYQHLIRFEVLSNEVQNPKLWPIRQWGGEANYNP